MTYFQKRDESWIIGISLLGLALMVFELSLSYRYVFTQDPNFRTFFLNIFLFNALHLICPFLVLAYWPEGQAFIKRKAKNYKLAIFATLAVPFVLLIAFASANKNVFDGTLFAKLTEPSVFWIWLLVPMWHGVRQSWGISMLMTKSSAHSQDLDQSESLALFSKRERLFSKVLTLIVLLSLAVDALRHLPNAPLYRTLICFSGVGLSAYYTFLCYKEKSFDGTNKTLFSLRFMAWSLISVSIMAQWFVILSHAIEYIGLMRRSKSAGSLPTIKIRNTVAIFTVGVLGYEVLKYSLNLGHLKLEDINTNFFFLIAWTAYPFFTLFHYLTDSLIYRFSDKDVKECFSGMLVGYSQPPPTADGRGKIA